MSTVHIVILPYQLLISCDSTNISTIQELCHLMPILTLHHGLARRRRCLSYPALHHLNAISALQPTPLLHRVAFLVRIQSERKRRRRRRCRQRRRCVSSVGCSLRLTSRHRWSARCWPLRPRNPCESFNRPKFSHDFNNLSLTRKENPWLLDKYMRIFSTGLVTPLLIFPLIVLSLAADFAL